MKPKMKRPGTKAEAVALLNSLSETTWNRYTSILCEGLKNSGMSEGAYHVLYKRDIDPAYAYAFNLIAGHRADSNIDSAQGFQHDKPSSIEFYKKGIDQWFKKELIPRRKSGRLDDVPSYNLYVNDFVRGEERKRFANQEEKQNKRAATSAQRRTTSTRTSRPRVQQSVRNQTVRNQTPTHKSISQTTWWFWLVSFALIFLVSYSVDAYRMPGASQMPFYIGMILSVALYTYVSTGKTRVSWQRYFLFLAPLIGLSGHPFLSIVAFLCMLPALSKKAGLTIFSLINRGQR